MDHAVFMTEALKLAQGALERGEFPVGCVMVYQGDIIANGVRRHTRGKAKNEIDHAEMVALRRLSELPGEIDSGQVIVYCTMEPCLMCFSAILLSGIRTIVYAYEDAMGGGTGIDLSALSPLYRDMKIQIIPHILREESLKLFQAYFSHPGNTYWKGSFLEQYTINQQ